MKKNDLIERSKRTLGEKIDNFIRNDKNYKGQKARVKFAEQVNNLLGIESFDEQTNYKKVSRWISGEVFPDFSTIIAISKVMGISLDELFDGNNDFFPKISILTKNEIKTLKQLIINANNENISSMYIPYAFNNEQISTEKVLHTREEVIKLYKEKSTKAFMLKRMKDFNALMEKGKIQNAEKHFPRFCSVEFIESCRIELPNSFYHYEEGYENSDPKSIFYTDTDEYYEQISTIWEKGGQDNYYNVVFFDEFLFDFPDNTAYNNLDRAYYYKTKLLANSVYKEQFGALIKRGIIEPVVFDFTINPDDFVADEIDENVSTIKKICSEKAISSFNTYENDCDLDTIRFSFKINLTELEQQEILKRKI